MTRFHGAATGLLLPLASFLAFAACSTDGAEPPRDDGHDLGPDVAAQDLVESDVAPPDLLAPDVALPDSTDGTDTEVVEDAGPDVGPAEDIEPTDTAVEDLADDAADATDDDVAVEDLSDGGSEVIAPSPCDPPLDAELLRWARARQPLQIDVTGGSGRYQYTLLSSPSGAILHPSSGQFIAGPEAPAIDVLEVRDRVCEGRVEVEVRVVPDMRVAPTVISLPPGSGFTPRVEEGSGMWTLQIAPGDTTGSSVARQADLPDALVAGETEGALELLVIDDGTNQVLVIEVFVDADGATTFSPPTIFMPIDSEYPSVVSRGSGWLAGPIVAVGEGPWLDHEADIPRWRADEAGDAQASAEDAFLPGVIYQDVQTISGVGPEPTLTGVLTAVWSALAPGDIDGDGWPEVIVGASAQSIDALRGGAVHVWSSGEGGFTAAPALTLGGRWRDGGFGAATAIGDFDGDARPDLAVGAPRGGPAAAGEVQLFGAAPGALFGPAPVWTGAAGDLRAEAGAALAACDFDGDGLDDLAVSAPGASVETDAGVFSSAGSVRIHFGRAGGLAAQPDVVLTGEVPSEDGWELKSGWRFGEALAAGDLDGDGACDLVVGSYWFDSTRGAVWVFSGAAISEGGAPVRPARVWQGRASSRLGSSLAVGDIDGDALPDLVAGQPLLSLTGPASNRHGAVRIAIGGDWVRSEAVAIEDDTDFTATFDNPNVTNVDANDEFGSAVAVGDVTGDEVPDLVVGGIRDEFGASGFQSHTGAISVFTGAAAGLPTGARYATLASPRNGDALGAAFAIIAPTENSPAPGIVAVAGRDRTDGAEYGRASIFDPSRPAAVTGVASTPLAMPSSPGGWEAGASLALVPDIDADGLPEVLVGAPGAPGPASGGQVTAAGGAAVYPGSASGFGAAPLREVMAFRHQISGGRWAQEVAVAESFDGDDHPDILLLAPEVGTLASFVNATNDYMVDSGCTTTRSDLGGVALFRGLGGGSFADQPAFIHFGPEGSLALTSLATLDFNGDGLTDIATAGPHLTGAGNAARAGVVQLVWGSALDPATTLTRVRCAADLTLPGFVAQGRLGVRIAAVGDLNGDGCEDLAAVAPQVNAPASLGGVIEILLGYGAPGCGAEARSVVIGSVAAATTIDASLAATDLDGDGLFDLAFGKPTLTGADGATGGVWVLRGVDLAALVQQAQPRLDAWDAPVPLGTADGVPALFIGGELVDGAFGFAAGLIPASAGATALPGPLVAIGAKRSSRGGVMTRGDVTIHALDLDAGTSREVAVVAAERHGSIHDTLSLLGFRRESDGRRFLVVGAPESSAIGAFSGAALIVPIDTVLEGSR